MLKNNLSFLIPIISGIGAKLNAGFRDGNTKAAPEHYVALLPVTLSDFFHPFEFSRDCENLKTTHEQGNSLPVHSLQELAENLKKTFRTPVGSNKEYKTFHSDRTIEKKYLTNYSGKDAEHIKLILQNNNKKEVRSFRESLQNGIAKSFHIQNRFQSLREGNVINASMHNEKQELSVLQKQDSETHTSFAFGGKSQLRKDHFMSNDFSKKYGDTSFQKTVSRNNMVTIHQNFGDIIIQPASLEVSTEQLKQKLQDALKQVRDSMYY